MLSIIIAVSALVLLSAFLGAFLGFASVKFKVEGDPLVDEIEALLPQTQCAQCGYPGCHAYAEAIANGDNISKCVPGAQRVVKNIAQLMGAEVKESPASATKPARQVAFIDADDCVGCNKCSQLCPVDAVIGEKRRTHKIMDTECMGCGACVERCPADCIEMIPVPITTDDWNWQLDTIKIDAELITSEREYVVVSH